MDILLLGDFLAGLPLDKPLHVDGEEVSLRLDPDGSKLAVVLWSNATDDSVCEAMRTSFQAALSHEAGLGLNAADELVLSRWLPGATGWSDAGDALADLLNHTALVRALVANGAREGKPLRAVLEEFSRTYGASGVRPRQPPSAWR